MPVCSEVISANAQAPRLAKASLVPGFPMQRHVISHREIPSHSCYPPEHTPRVSSLAWREHNHTHHVTRPASRHARLEISVLEATHTEHTEPQVPAGSRRVPFTLGLLCTHSCTHIPGQHTSDLSESMQTDPHGSNCRLCLRWAFWASREMNVVLSKMSCPSRKSPLLSPASSHPPTLPHYSSERKCKE